MNRTTINIAIIVSVVTLVGMAAIAINYSPAPAHAAQPTTCRYVTESHECFFTKHECEQRAISIGSTAGCKRVG